VNFNEGPNSDLNPLNGVVRYEFVEFLVRVAIEKFMVRGSCKSEYEAVKTMIDTILVPRFPEYDGNIWRDTRLFNENVEIVFRTYMPVF